MASTDAHPIPFKNAAYRVTFPILDADGDLVTGATGLDSEVSIDAGTFADCTNEATEIATASGMYYLDLTSGEMNGDTISVIVKTTSVGGKTTPIVLYPQETDDIRVAVTHWIATAVATVDTAGYPKVTLKSGTGAGELSLSSGTVALTSDFRIKKNTALAAFPFRMTDSTDHVSPKTGLTVTAQRSLDGGAFAACANAVTEISSGWYKISFAATDLNADTVALKFTATGADQLDFTVVTQTE